MAVNLQIAYPDPIIQKIVINRGVAGQNGADADVSSLVAKADYTTAFSILAQQSGTGSPEALQVGTNTLIGRVTGGGSEIDDLSPATVRMLLNVEDGATADQDLSGFAPLVHTHVSADVADSSTGGNGVTDASKLVEFGAAGSITASSTISVAGGSVSDPVGIINNNGSLTASRIYTLPDKTGTVAMTSDITVSLTGTETLTNKTLTNPSVNNYIEGVVSIGNSGATQTIVLTFGTFQTVTLTADCTFTMPTATAGKSFTLQVLTGAGAFAPTFTGVKWVDNVNPVFDEVAGNYYFATFFADGTRWSGSVSGIFTI